MTFLLSPVGLQERAAELARLTGWTYFDARQYNQARAYFTEVRVIRLHDARQAPPPFSRRLKFSC